MKRGGEKKKGKKKRKGGKEGRGEQQKSAISNQSINPSFPQKNCRIHQREGGKKEEDESMLQTLPTFVFVIVEEKIHASVLEAGQARGGGRKKKKEGSKGGA